MSTPTANQVSLVVYRDGLTGSAQLTVEDRPGNGTRLSGPKLAGHSTLLLRCQITERTAKELRYYLDRAFPPAATT